MISAIFIYFYAMILQEKAFVCIASIPQRESSLKETINSLLPQVDKIYLYLNNYDEATADQIKNISPDKIEYIIGDNVYGDAGKFYWADKLNGYIFSCDDDLYFPPDYIKTAINGIEKYGRKAIVCFHGRELKPVCASYYRDYRAYYGFNNTIENDTFVHVAGTGCMAWHSSVMNISMSHFSSANMADIHLSVLAQKNKIPIVILSHKPNWIKGTYYPSLNSISGMATKNDKEQTELVNKIDWRLYEVMWTKESLSNGINPTIAYIINLSHWVDRYKSVFHECIKNDIVPIRIEAISGKNNFSGITSSPLMQAHYGCTTSHIKALEYAYEQGDEYSLILEDDCSFTDDFRSKLIECVRQLPQDWDLIYLGGSLINASIYQGGDLINIDAVEKFSENLYRAKNVLTTHSYIIKNNSIPKLLEKIKSRLDRIDILFCEFQKHNNCFIVYPELAWQKEGHSDIVGRVTNNIHLRYGQTA